MMLDAIVKEEIGRQFIENNNIRCNKSVKITGVDQICDVVIIFNLLNHIENQTKLKDIQFDSLYSVIDAIFSELKEMYKLHLKSNKVRILEDCIAHFPYMLYNTCACGRIIQ